MAGSGLQLRLGPEGNRDILRAKAVPVVGGFLGWPFLL